MHAGMAVERLFHRKKDRDCVERSSLGCLRRSIIGMACWLSLFLVLIFPVTVYAGEVYGRVIDKSKTFKPGDEITISGRDPGGNAISVTAITDKTGHYRISLPPGSYQVKFLKDNKTFEGRVQSFPHATDQDIVLLPVR